MALPSLGAISMADYNAELKKTAGSQISMNDTGFRAITGKTTPNSTESMSDGYGKSAEYVFNYTIASHTNNFEIRQAALNAGWNGTTPLNATITINNGVYVYSTSTGSYAFSTGTSFPAGTKLRLDNYGYILGRGGDGGAGGSISAGYGGGGAGPALYAGYTISINNGGVIAGGGGGGGGGGA
jgi:hypothetical protein